MGDVVLGIENCGFENLLNNQLIIGLKFVEIDCCHGKPRIVGESKRDFRDFHVGGFKSFQRFLEKPLELAVTALLPGEIEFDAESLIDAGETLGLDHHADDGIFQLCF